MFCLTRSMHVVSRELRQHLYETERKVGFYADESKE